VIGLRANPARRRILSRIFRPRAEFLNSKTRKPTPPSHPRCNLTDTSSVSTAGKWHRRHRLYRHRAEFPENPRNLAHVKPRRTTLRTPRRNPDGSRADFIVGADGANSIVRCGWRIASAPRSNIHQPLRWFGTRHRFEFLASFIVADLRHFNAHHHPHVPFDMSTFVVEVDS
jgi:hypothetical protein